jgi:hypothetical protein
MSAVLSAPSPTGTAQWSIPSKISTAYGEAQEWAGERPVSDAIQQAAKRLEGLKLAPPVVGKFVVESDVHFPSTDTDVDALLDTHKRQLEQFCTGETPRIKGAEVTKARDEAYAAYQAATDRMPTAEAAADLVVAYRRSHRGLENFCRGHYDAVKMYARLAMWTAGRDETGEQWDRLIGLLQMRGIKPSTEGLTKRAKRDGEHTSDLTRRVKGWTDLAGRFHASEVEAITASWNIKVERATDEVLKRAKAARVTVRSYLISHEAEKPVAALSRALKGREAHLTAIGGT